MSIDELDFLAWLACVFQSFECARAGDSKGKHEWRETANSIASIIGSRAYFYRMVN